MRSLIDAETFQRWRIVELIDRLRRRVSGEDDEDTDEEPDGDPWVDWIDLGGEG